MVWLQQGSEKLIFEHARNQVPLQFLRTLHTILEMKVITYYLQVLCVTTINGVYTLSSDNSCPLTLSVKSFSVSMCDS